MHPKEKRNILEKRIPQLGFSIGRDTVNETTVQNFNNVMEAVVFLNDIDNLQPWTTPILENNVVKNNLSSPEISISKRDYKGILNLIDSLRDAAKMLLEVIKEETEYPNNSLLIKLPKLNSFEELSKIANDFKIAIEMPLHDSNETLKIEKAEEGSIWITVVTSLAGIGLISKLVNVALKIAKVSAQLKMHHQQSRTIGLKNDLLETILEQQKTFLKHNLEEETKTIFDPSIDPESFKRYKTSVEMLSDLIERGAEIKPAAIEDEETNKNFPDFKEVNLLGELFTKKIGNNL